jgi:hypothetical protein
MPPFVPGGSSAQQTSSPVVSTSMSAQSSGVTMSCADSSRATPSHARYHARRQRAGDRHRAVVPRARASAAAPPPPVAARPLPHEPSRWVAHRRPAAAVPAQRCRSRRLTEALRQLALRYRRPPPTLGHYRGRAERRARRCGAGSGFYSASGTISPIYSRSSRLLNNIYCPGITPGLALVLYNVYCKYRYGCTAVYV